MAWSEWKNFNGEIVEKETITVNLGNNGTHTLSNLDYKPMVVEITTTGVSGYAYNDYSLSVRINESSNIHLDKLGFQTYAEFVSDNEILLHLNYYHQPTQSAPCTVKIYGV